MAPAPPKRPSSGSAAGTPPRRTSTAGVRAPATRRPPAPEPEAEPGQNDTVMGLGDDEAGESTSPGPVVDASAESGEPVEGANATVVFDTRTMSRKAAGAGAGPSGKLVVVKGPKQGAEFTLGAGETTIGRNADNTVVIPDISVSRRHVVLVKEGPTWTLLDQGSGNGTLMNGEKVDQYPLQDGDVFCIGDTELQFQVVNSGPPRRTASTAAAPVRRATGTSRVAPRAVPGKPVATGDHTGQIALPADEVADPAASKRKKVLILVTAVVGVLVLGGVMVKRSHDQGVIAAAQAAAAAQEQAQHEAADAAMGAGKALVVQSKFADALVKFNEAKEKGSTDADLGDYIDRCTREVSSEKAVADAREALAKGALASAAESLGKVPPESMLADKAKELKEQVKAAVPARLAMARGKIATKDFAGASAILEDVAKVAAGDKALDDTQDALAQAQNKPPPVHTTRGPPKAVDHTQEVISAFKDGDLKRSRELAAQFGESDEGCKKLGQEIAQFEVAYAKMDEDQSAFRVAHDLDQRIARGRSFFTQKINGHVLAASLKQCVTNKTAGRMGEAFKACRAAKEADPGNAEANAVLLELQSKAKELWIQGYQEVGADNDAARRDLSAVRDMTPPDDELHGKAVRKLKEMEQ
jgi:tetratricopeptide (TPR) repeat protein